MDGIVFDKAAFTRQLAERPEASTAGVIGELRDSAVAQLESTAYPDRSQEAWRYTPVSGLLGHQYQLPPSPETLPASALEGLKIEGLDCWRAVLVNGRFDAGLSALSGLPEGVRLLGLHQADSHGDDEIRSMLRSAAGPAEDLFAAMNLAGLYDGLVLRIGDGVRLDRPIEILHVATGLDRPTMVQPRLLLRAGEGAEATLIERYVSLGPALYFNNVVVDVETAPGAGLSHVRVQTESDLAYQVARQTLRQHEDSRYSLHSLVQGGAWSRLHLDCRLLGEGASTDLKGLYLINGRRFADQHLKVSHKLPHCRSSADFRGILNGAGRAVFDGNILVERDAQKTDAHLSNDNLMLSRDAEVDTKPQLEIYADDVKCSHGTTVGELDPNTLFYLRSRGIGIEKAKRLLCQGFARDLFEDVESPALSQFLIELIDQRLIGTDES